MPRFRYSAALIGGLLLSGLLSPAVMSGAAFGQEPPAGGHAMAPGGPAGQAYAEGMQTMNKAMQDVRPTGDPDRDFVQMMLPHHQGAVDMANTELHYGKDPMLRKMAREIVRAQQKEIARMKAWQAAHQ